MASRQDSERAKAQQEKFQAILSAMLKDEDNKYCEDCDAKGPRWASWNLGIFLCIRCAGIHRNLGVHISKVKSVNLDSWTAEQVAMMQEMGNSRARAVYEAGVPDNFQRPQSNAAVEAFVRSKYEAKKYIAREWVVPKPVVPKEWLEDDRTEKKKIRNKPTATASVSSTASGGTSSVQSRPDSTSRPKPSAASPAAVSRPQDLRSAPQPQPTRPSASTDLLGLDTEIAAGKQEGDLLTDLFGGSPATSAAQTTSQPDAFTPVQNGTAEPNLFEQSATENGGGGAKEEKKSTKDSIMALYGSSGAQPQVFGVPGGVYLPQQQMMAGGAMAPMMQQQVIMGMQPGMMGQPMQQGMMGMPQQQGMMGMPQTSSAAYSMQSGAGQPGMMMMSGPGGGGGGGMMVMGTGGGYMQQQPYSQSYSQAYSQPYSQPGMPAQYNPMQQQMQLQQMQHQMSGMSLGGPQMAGIQQQQQQRPQQQQMGMGGGGVSWGGALSNNGHTMSSTLWQ